MLRVLGIVRLFVLFSILASLSYSIPVHRKTALTRDEMNLRDMSVLALTSNTTSLLSGKSSSIDAFKSFLANMTASLGETNESHSSKRDSVRIHQFVLGYGLLALLIIFGTTYCCIVIICGAA